MLITPEQVDTKWPHNLLWLRRNDAIFFSDFTCAHIADNVWRTEGNPHYPKCWGDLRSYVELFIHANCTESGFSLWGTALKLVMHCWIHRWNLFSAVGYFAATGSPLWDTAMKLVPRSGTHCLDWSAAEGQSTDTGYLLSDTSVKIDSRFGTQRWN